jgi:hypothetical protein
MKIENPIVIKSLTKQHTMEINLKVAKQFYFRVFAVKILLRLCSRILNCSIVFKCN